MLCFVCCVYLTIGYYSLIGEPNPWIEFYKYDPATDTATITGNVDPWLTSIAWWVTRPRSGGPLGCRAAGLAPFPWAPLPP